MLEAATDDEGFNTSQPSLPPATTGVIPPGHDSRRSLLDGGVGWGQMLVAGSYER